jgi:hypothetical protein
VKAILAILCGLLIGSPAIAADLELKCRGFVGEGRSTRLTPVEFAVSVSDLDVTVQADPKHDLHGAPIRSVLRLVLTKSDTTTFEFESAERMTRPGYEALALISGIINSRRGTVTIGWRGVGLPYISGKCEFLVSMRSTTSPKET